MPDCPTKTTSAETLRPGMHLPNGAQTGPPVVDSHALLAGGRELVIRHGSDRYRLLLTGQNKLILTK